MAKFTAIQISELSKKAVAAGEKMKKESKAKNTTSVTLEEAVKKLSKVNSPMIVFQGWSATTGPGGSIGYSIGIFNPDPTPADSLFVHAFIGSGNVDPVAGTFLLNVDPRFPRLTEPAFSGLSIPAGGVGSVGFNLAVPASAEKTNYLGESCLMQFNWHDVGTYLDRSVWPFQVV